MRRGARSARRAIARQLLDDRRSLRAGFASALRRAQVARGAAAPVEALLVEFDRDAVQLDRALSDAAADSGTQPFCQA